MVLTHRNRRVATLPQQSKSRRRESRGLVIKALCLEFKTSLGDSSRIRID
jgi:hypothetical protein